MKFQFSLSALLVQCQWLLRLKICRQILAKQSKIQFSFSSRCRRCWWWTVKRAALWCNLRLTHVRMDYCIHRAWTVFFSQAKVVYINFAIRRSKSEKKKKKKKEKTTKKANIKKCLYANLFLIFPPSEIAKRWHLSLMSDFASDRWPLVLFFRLSLFVIFSKKKKRSLKLFSFQIQLFASLNFLKRLISNHSDVNF